MTELKTLKDIEKEYYDCDDFALDLKQEAIKWVKAFQLTDPAISEAFIDFFNLTEEDLK